MTTEKVSLKHWLETRWRGTLMAVIIGAASLFVSEHTAVLLFCSLC